MPEAARAEWIFQSGKLEHYEAWKALLNGSHEGKDEG